MQLVYSGYEWVELVPSVVCDRWVVLGNGKALHRKEEFKGFGEAQIFKRPKVSKKTLWEIW